MIRGPACRTDTGATGRASRAEDNPRLPPRTRRMVEQAGWPNVTLLVSLGPCAPVDEIIIGYNPPIVLQRPDLLKAACANLKPGGRLSAVVPLSRSARVPAFVRAIPAPEGSGSPRTPRRTALAAAPCASRSAPGWRRGRRGTPRGVPPVTPSRSRCLISARSGCAPTSPSPGCRREQAAPGWVRRPRRAPRPLRPDGRCRNRPPRPRCFRRRPGWPVP